MNDGTSRGGCATVVNDQVVKLDASCFVDGNLMLVDDNKPVDERDGR